MNKFEKSILAIIVSAGIGNVAIIGKVDSNITTLGESVYKLEKQVITVDNRVRKIEIKQAELGVYLNNYNLKLAAN